jgi:hypothetical protein
MDAAIANYPDQRFTLRRDTNHPAASADAWKIALNAVDHALRFDTYNV